MTTPSRTHARGLLAGVLVLAAVAAVVVLTTGRVTASTVPSGLPRVVIVGDSLSTGHGTSPDWAWPHLLAVADRDRLDIVNSSEDGQGYLAVGDAGGTFGTHADEAVTPDTGTVLFFGSENDMGRDTTTLRDTAIGVLLSVHATAPRARVIVVGPTAFTSAPEPGRLAVRDALAAAAAATHSRFVDPIAAGWLDSPQDIGPDGDHPTVPGQQRLEAQMSRLLPG